MILLKVCYLLLLFGVAVISPHIVSILHGNRTLISNFIEKWLILV